MLSGRDDLCIFVCLPSTRLNPVGSRIRKVSSLVVPVHSSERVTFLSSVQTSLVVLRQCQYQYVSASQRPMYFNGTGNVWFVMQEKYDGMMWTHSFGHAKELTGAWS